MAEKTVQLTNDEGFHARPAGVFAKKASEFKSTIEISAKGQKKNAKSIMGLMGLGLEKGDQITIVAHGADETLALDTLVKLVENQFKL